MFGERRNAYPHFIGSLRLSNVSKHLRVSLAAAVQALETLCNIKSETQKHFTIAHPRRSHGKQYFVVSTRERMFVAASFADGVARYSLHLACHRHPVSADNSVKVSESIDIVPAFQFLNKPPQVAQPMIFSFQVDAFNHKIGRRIHKHACLGFTGHKDETCERIVLTHRVQHRDGHSHIPQSREPRHQKIPGHFSTFGHKAPG